MSTSSALSRFISGTPANTASIIGTTASNNVLQSISEKPQAAILDTTSNNYEKVTLIALM